MGLRVAWEVANIYEYFVEQHSVLSEARDAIWDKYNPSNARPEEKIQLGNLYESLRSADRKQATDTAKQIMADYCEDIIDVMNLACLVERDSLEDFAKGVFEASKAFDNSYVFDYTGPWAPHNLITLDLQAPSAKTKSKTVDVD